MMKINLIVALLSTIVFGEPVAEPKADADAGFYGGGSYYGGGLGYGYYGKRDADAGFYRRYYGGGLHHGGGFYHGSGFRGRYYGKREADADAGFYSGHYRG